MRKVIVARRAQMDLRRLVDFLAEKNPRAANAASCITHVGFSATGYPSTPTSSNL